MSTHEPTFTCFRIRHNNIVLICFSFYSCMFTKQVLSTTPNDIGSDKRQLYSSLLRVDVIENDGISWNMQATI